MNQKKIEREKLKKNTTLKMNTNGRYYLLSLNPYPNPSNVVGNSLFAIAPFVIYCRKNAHNFQFWFVYTA